MNDKINEFKDALQEQMDKELDEMPTFSEKMAEHIRGVYAKLFEEERKWLEQKWLEQKWKEEQS